MKSSRRLRLNTLAMVFLLLVQMGGFIPNAQAAAKPVTATAKYDKKSGKVVVKGKTSQSIQTSAQVSVFDPGTQKLLYSASTDAKRNFNLNLLAATAVPCLVRVEVTNPNNRQVNKLLLNVSGAPTSCKTTGLIPACAISTPVSDINAEIGETITFTANGIKAKKGSEVSYSWSIGDESESKSGVSISHQFAQTGKFKVTLNVAVAGRKCSDDLSVTVMPLQADLPQGTVTQQTAPSSDPKKPEGLARDKNSYVVLPFEEGGMMSGSNINLPYNTYPSFNALNAQVFKKIEHKPKLINNAEVSVVYSAALNPLDPVAPDSINSTSQNFFADDKIGSNYDYAATLASGNTTFIQGQDFTQAKIKKSEFWDRIRQPIAEKVLNLPQKGLAVADTISSFTPPKAFSKPDEGVPGNIDQIAGRRKMPGANDPYKANDPQSFDYNANLSKFMAQFIPATDVDDKGRINPYPIMRVQAKADNEVVATTDAVYTTASETRCRECHLKGGIAAPAELWRTPVRVSEMTDPKDSSKPGPATGAGSFKPGNDPSKFWPPAVHNVFEAKHPFTKANQLAIKPEQEAAAGIERDQNGLLKTRVAASRWKKPDGSFSDTNPTNDTTWQLQLQLAYKDGTAYMPTNEVGTRQPSWEEEEKAAIWNMLLLHDYMVFMGLTVPASPYALSTQLLDSHEDLRNAARGRSLSFCYSSCHISEARREVSWSARAFVYQYSDYSRAEHGFHAKLQVYKADNSEHKKGDLIRDERGHPIMWGGRGWDSQHNDDFGIGQPLDPATGKQKIANYQVTKNNWDPELFPMREDADLLLPFGDNIAMEDNCLKCHAGPNSKSYRDIHHAAGLKCDDCHGDMAAVGNLYGNEKYNANMWGAGKYTDGTQHFRYPWQEEPNCGSCHVGDANLSNSSQGYFSAGVMKKAFDGNDDSQRSRDPIDVRFSVMPFKESRLEKLGDNQYTFAEKEVSNVLYRKSFDVHGSGTGNDIACSACHGGSHAIWPNPDSNANDNLAAKQLQGFKGNIVECSVCHIKDDFKTGLVATDGGDANKSVAQGVRTGNVVSPATTTNGRAYLAGPHGMHPVNDESWYKHAAGAASSRKPVKVNKQEMNGGWHNDMAKMAGPNGEDQCAACHGNDHKGTRLSKTLADRVFVTDKGKSIKVAAGTVIGCDTCHSLQKSFNTNLPKLAKGQPLPKTTPPAPVIPDWDNQFPDSGPGHGGHVNP